MSNQEVKLIDARGPRFGAVITTFVLAAALVTQSFALIAMQLVVFAIGAFAGPQSTPYSFIYRKFVKPRLSGDMPTEDIRQPQFAQAIGFLFALTATTALLLDLSAVFTVATGFALGAAFLNAAFNFCLGCEMYVLIARVRSRFSKRELREEAYNLPNL